MSDSDVPVPVVTEKSVLTEFLQLYRTFPCLWDHKHKYYGNRGARDKAYVDLLEIYKKIQENATVLDVKKKIEYMRTAYKREHKKVVNATLKGELHRPVLWYYEHLMFLDEKDNSVLKTPIPIHYPDGFQESREILIDDDSDDSDEPVKRRKIKRKNSSISNPIYVSEDHNNEVSIRGNIYETDHLDQELTQPYIVSNEPESFGRTIGFQLKELQHLQRVFAEKLISDVIFYGRMGHLDADTSLTFNK